jgi:predicted permease
VSDTRRTRTELWYRRLLHLYPRAFRERFAADLVDLFRDTRRAAAARGRLALAGFWLRTVTDIVTSAAAERLRSQPGPPAEPRRLLMAGLVQDVRYALRMTARRPALSLVIVLTLALGIGANTAIFSLVHTVLLTPQPYPGADRLVRVWEQNIENPTGGRPVSAGNFFDWKDRVASLEDIAWSRDAIFNLTGDGEPESLLGYRYSANMLSVLGVQPAIGRGFTAEDDRPGAPNVVLLSDRLWQRRYGGEAGILGRGIMLNGESYTVIGVMPPGFSLPQTTELWTPIAVSPDLAANRSARVLRLLGRLKPGVSREQALAELGPIYEDLAVRHPDVNKGLGPLVEQLGDTGDAKPLLLILMAGVALVLLIACANVANLLLADATGRRRELAVRSALGASRYRIARQMLTESVGLALIGGAIGTLVMWWTREGLLALFPTQIANLNLPAVERIEAGPAVFAFAFAVSLAAGLLFGALPAWSLAGSNVSQSLKEGERAGSASRRTHSALIVAEVAIAIVLLAGALLMVQSFQRVQRQSFGFEVDRVMSGRVILPQYRYGTGDSIRQFADTLVARLEAVPGVEAVGLTNYLPLSGWGGSIGFQVEGHPPATQAEQPTASFHVASDGYFRAMGIPLVSGRAFTARDTTGAPPVVIVDETLARRHWPGENPVGRRVLLSGASGPIPHDVVGVAGDVRAHGLEEPVQGGMYLPFGQAPGRVIGIALRTSLDPMSLAGPMRQAVWSVDAEQPVTYALPMAELASESLAFRRAGMLLASSFGLLALVLAALGIYGVLSYAVSRRTRELGMRMALGATPGGIARLVVRDGLATTAVGLVLGLAAAVALTRYLESVLYDVRPGDPLTYAGVAALLLLTALAATWLPAWRATRVDPLEAIRAE